MSWSCSWVCGGGPGNPGSIVVSERKKEPPVSSLVALMRISEPPMVWRSPSPGGGRFLPSPGYTGSGADQHRHGAGTADAYHCPGNELA